MKRFSLVVFLLGVLIVALLAWQLYGVHHYPNMNETHGFNRTVITAPVNSMS